MVAGTAGVTIAHVGFANARIVSGLCLTVTASIDDGASAGNFASQPCVPIFDWGSLPVQSRPTLTYAELRAKGAVSVQGCSQSLSQGKSLVHVSRFARINDSRRMARNYNPCIW